RPLLPTMPPRGAHHPPCGILERESRLPRAAVLAGIAQRQRVGVAFSCPTTLHVFVQSRSTRAIYCSPHHISPALPSECAHALPPARRSGRARGSRRPECASNPAESDARFPSREQ